MNKDTGVLAVIPARGGSKGLPGKNTLLFAGLPLIAHSIMFARQCQEIERVLVTTDSEEIAGVAKAFGGDAPFLRPQELAQHDTPMWPVLRHALATAEELDGKRYQWLLLLDPTSPARERNDLTEALQQLQGSPSADGIISVSRPPFNPVWHCVVQRDGVMADLFEGGGHYHRRQDVPVVYRINGVLYLWRTDFVRTQQSDWRGQGRHLLYEIPDVRAISIDDLNGFRQAELLVKEGLIRFAWLESKNTNLCGR